MKKICSPIFYLSIACCYSFCMKQPKTKLPQQISRQLITTHNIHEQEKKLLQDIIDNYPHWIQLNPSYQQLIRDANFSIYTPQYFKDMIAGLETAKKTDYATNMEKTLRKEAILYITYVATNDEQWPTINNKLSHIKECFQQYTQPYLEATWERYKPTMVISTMPAEIEEPHHEKGTVEEVSSEEEEKIILEQPIPSSKTQSVKGQYKKTAKQPYSAKTTKGKQKPKEQKEGWLSTIWNTTKRFLGKINHFVRTIYYSFLSAVSGIFGESDITKSPEEIKRAQALREKAFSELSPEAQEAEKEYYQ